MSNLSEKLKVVRETYFGSIWDILTWLSLAGIFLWGIAKALGWINTPLIIEIMPLLLAAFAIGSFFQDVKNFRKEQRAFNKGILAFNKEILTRVARSENRAFK